VALPASLRIALADLRKIVNLSCLPTFRHQFPFSTPDLSHKVPQLIIQV
jgi:hypothetical protein